MTTFEHMHSTRDHYDLVFLHAHSGIGRDIAVALYKRRAQTVALSRTQADLDSLKEEVCLHSCPL